MEKLSTIYVEASPLRAHEIWIIKPLLEAGGANPVHVSTGRGSYRARIVEILGGSEIVVESTRAILRTNATLRLWIAEETPCASSK